jgi:hypothetical protein
MAQPSPPSTFFGSATIDGASVPDGSDVRGYIDGKDCTQTGQGLRGTVFDAGTSAYVISVMHESQEPGCGKAGATVTFTVAGRATGQTATWKAGAQRLDLNAGSGAPVPLPTATPTPPVTPPPAAAPPSPAVVTGQSNGGTASPPAPAAASSTAVALPSGSPPVDNINLPFGQQGPRPPVTSPGATPNDGGSGAWIAVGIVVALLVAAGGGGGVLLARHRR